MAKGYQANRERNEQLNSFGKAVGKRAGFKCEWCESRDDLRLWDYRPDLEPEPDGLADPASHVGHGQRDVPPDAHLPAGQVVDEIAGLQPQIRATLGRIHDIRRRSLRPQRNRRGARARRRRAASRCRARRGGWPERLRLGWDATGEAPGLSLRWDIGREEELDEGLRALSDPEARKSLKRLLDLSE